MKYKASILVLLLLVALQNVYAGDESEKKRNPKKETPDKREKGESKESKFAPARDGKKPAERDPWMPTKPVTK